MSRIYFNGPTSAFLDDNTIAVGLQNIQPSYTSEVARDPRLIVNSFGDGYSQRAPDGINYTPLTYTLIFENRSLDVCTAINNFLFGESPFYDRVPEEPFFWTAPFPFSNKVRLWTFSKPTFRYVSFTNMTVTVTFTESFEP